MESGDQPTTTGTPTAFELVAEFHRAFGQPVRTVPSGSLAGSEADLRQAILDEEVEELRQAIAEADVVGIADALADLVYVICGTAHYYGIDLDAAFEEVHRSNMTKLDREGKPIYRSDGKVLKGPRYKPPDLARAMGLPSEPPPTERGFDGPCRR